MNRLGVAALLVAYAAPRIGLAVVREPFFDELFTLWISRLPVDGMFAVLLHDSGPPLYYALTRLLTIVSGGSIGELRAFSIVLSLVIAIVLVRRREFVALALLAAFPPHVYFSAEARAYVLASLLIGVAALAFDDWLDHNSRKSLIVGAAALTAAAYTHYYGVLFLALPLVLGRFRRDAVAAFTGMAVAVTPLFVLAWVQPREAIGWMQPIGRLIPLRQLSFGAPNAEVFLPEAPLPVQIAGIAILVAVAVLTWKQPRASRFALMTLLPVGVVMIVPHIYFPVRFESVIAVPLALWMASALAAAPRWGRTAAVTAAMAIGFGISTFAIGDHASRPADPFRQTAMFAVARIPQSETIVASGYVWLELAVHRDVVAFPREQAVHPGWRARPDRAELQREVRRLPREFIWAGEIQSIELQELRRQYRIEPLFDGGGVGLARAVALGSP